MPPRLVQIPWDLLASNLAWIASEDRRREDVRILPKSTPEKNQKRDKDLGNFIDVFVKNIKLESQASHALTKDTKAVQWEDVILTDEVVEEIPLTVEKALYDLGYYFGARYRDSESLIPSEERVAFAFLRPWDNHHRCGEFDRVNSSALYNLEIVKIMLLCGQMEGVFPVCRQLMWFRAWWSMTECPHKVCSSSSAPDPYFLDEASFGFQSCMTYRLLNIGD